MERERLIGTNLFIRNLGSGRSRITIIESLDLLDYAPIRIAGTSCVLWNADVSDGLRVFFAAYPSRARRNKVFPGGIGSTIDEGLRKFIL